MGKKKQNKKSLPVAPLPIETGWSMVFAILAVPVYFLVMRLNTVDAGKGLAMVCILFALVIGAVRFRTLRDRISIPFVVLALLVIVNGISTFYAVSGKFALREFLRVLVSFCMGIGLLSLATGEGEKPGRTMAAVLARSVALSGLVSIDYISTRMISTPVLNFLGRFTSDYEDLAGLETGIRMVSISGNANIFAGYIGIGVLLSLSLALSSESVKERMGHIVCLFINALSFVLAFSMGASGVIVVAFLVYLALERRENRAGLFLLMAETLGTTVAAAALIAMTSFDAWDGSMRPVPLLCALLGSLALCLEDRFIGSKIERKLVGRGKLVFILIAVALAVLVVFAVAAMSLTGGTELDAGESLRRSAYPEPGDYVLTSEVTGSVTVKVTSQNRQDTMMHTETTLYSGDLSKAAFTVPEDSKVVYFTFRSKEGAELERVHYEGVTANEAGEVPLGYKLLPGFVANRLQGLRANQNAIQRTVFFEDGIKLFKRSPVFGLGMGAFESAIMSVQSFFYETKYAHNHYVQVLAETGVVGLSVFVGLLAVCGWTVFAARKKEKAHSLVPALGAVLVFMAGHAAVEVVFSASDYLPVAFGVFVLIGFCCGDAIGKPVLSKKVKTTVVGICAVVLVAFLGLLYNNMAARKLVGTVTFENLERAAQMDQFEWADYLLSYVVSAKGDDISDGIREKADGYAERLEQVSSNTIPIHLAEYYFDTGRPDRGFEMIEKYVGYVSSKTASWTAAFGVLERYWDGTEDYREGVLEVYQLLQTWDEENMGTITLDKDTMAFIERMGG